MTVCYRVSLMVSYPMLTQRRVYLNLQENGNSPVDNGEVHSDSSHVLETDGVSEVC